MNLKYYPRKFKLEVRLAEEVTLFAFQLSLSLIAMKYKMLKSITVRSTAFLARMGPRHSYIIKVFLTG